MSIFQSQAQKRQSAAKLGKLDDFFIPADEQDWSEIFQRPKLRDKITNTAHTIHTTPADWVASASDASHVQYIMLRSYSPRTATIKELHDTCHRFGFTQEVRDRADDLLAASTEWSRYLQLLDTDDSVDNIPDTSDKWPGAFSIVKWLQEQTMTVRGVHDREVMQVTSEGTGREPGVERRRRPRRVAQLEEAEDEEIPNAAVIALLQSISHFAEAKLEWTFNRVHFQCEFGNKEFSAFTDGGLRSKSTMDILAIVEVKKRMRTDNTPPILIQEACEVVGWLMNYSVRMALFNDHFMLVSQDRHEIFVTFAPFKRGYEYYLRNGTTTNDFLVMKAFGPFRTAYRKDMEEFGRIILAATLIVKPAR
ncbi:hypothetical protein PENNAL_c0032G01035 [Penicillium nalgiovense]|uniref:Uncharacterized protein n=1 Tax=Penicillium nalgiovense TaxID=60175 RepID=A0A1V6Y866_PENNA|nr:hypothetical protein PENNAL_c0032G01035 [Penicillium nalgiovense]